MNARILVVEDDAAISNLISMNLTVAGYTAQTANSGAQALRLLQSGALFDLAVCDIMLPETDGFDLLDPLNRRGIPVIFLTARNDIESKIRGLKGGAEDYIVKPFEILELLVRVEKVLERQRGAATELYVNDLVIHRGERTVTRGEETLCLKPREFELLCLLAKNRNIALSRDKLLAEIWGMHFLGESRTVDVHIAQLRKKTGLRIASVPKVGYRLETES
ncbi:MAG: response regulator transcription factor [Clostridiales bacterium]|nr:response regulator transcription factor [Clostridiales bacterium]